MQAIVSVLTCKADPSGDPREPDVVNMQPIWRLRLKRLIQPRWLCFSGVRDGLVLCHWLCSAAGHLRLERLD
jgi:hypothetical protein